MFSRFGCLSLPKNAAEQLLLMQKMILHKTKSRSSWAAQLIAPNRLPKAHGGLTLSRCLALRGEFCECLKPLFYQ
jgi:hypothetical protein